MSVSVRKIASVQKISMIIKTKTSEQAQVNGWTCFVVPNTFKIYQHVAYLEIDTFIFKESEYFEKIKSFIPDDASMIETTDNGFFLKTMQSKSSGLVSQGLILPLDIFNLPQDIEIGTDISKQIGVVKYDDETSMPMPTQVITNDFPIWIPKSDQMRIQNFTMLPEYQAIEFEVSQKLDGTSMTVYHKDGFVGICSRNKIVAVYNGSMFIRISDPGFPMERIVTESGLGNTLLSMKKNIAIQAELTGPTIQQGATSVFLMNIYDIYDISMHRYMTPDERLSFIDQIKNSKIVSVPIVKRRFRVFELLQSSEDIYANILKFADDVFRQEKCEGLVFKSETDVRLSFKAVSNEYLLETDRLIQERKAKKKNNNKK